MDLQDAAASPHAGEESRRVSSSTQDDSRPTVVTSVHQPDAHHNDQHNAQPIDEPVPAPVRSSVQNESDQARNVEPYLSVERRCDRIIKTFSIEKFDGSNTNEVDSGAARWFARFEVLLENQEDMYNVQIPDRRKVALFLNHLTGNASDWHVSNTRDLRDRSFASVGRAFKRKFGCKMTKMQIKTKVTNEHKKASESYAAFSLRLRNMAAASSPEGIETIETANLALSALIANAWPSQTNLLKVAIREDSNHPFQETERAVTRLCSLAGHQGILSGQRPSPTQLTGAGKRKAANDSIKPRGKFAKRDYSKERCAVCGKLGHNTSYHNKFVARQQAGMAHVAQAALPNQTSPIDNSTIRIVKTEDDFDEPHSYE